MAEKKEKFDVLNREEKDQLQSSRFYCWEDILRQESTQE